MLPNLPGYFSAEAYDLNDAGMALGRAFTGDDDRAVRWDAAGAATELGHLGLSDTGKTLVNPRALNSAGVAVGSAYKHDASGVFLGAVPVRWDAGSTAAIELGTPAPGGSGLRFGAAEALNDSGVAVGNVFKSPAFPTDEFGPRAARWDSSGTAVTVLGTLGTAPNGEASTAAYAINASGLIVGTASEYNAVSGLLEPRAVYWDSAGTILDLNTLIDPAAGWLLTHAFAVSDTGWIAGDGYFDPDGGGGQEAYGRHFLMHVPEPSTGILLTAALGCLILLRRKRRVG